MPIAYNRENGFPYVLERDRKLPEDERTTFMLCPISWADRDAILEQLEGAGQSKREQIKLAATVVRKGVVGWSGFRHRDGSKIACNSSGGVLDDASLDLVIEYAEELFGEIWRLSGLGNLAQGKSSSSEDSSEASSRSTGSATDDEATPIRLSSESSRPGSSAGCVTLSSSPPANPPANTAAASETRSSASTPSDSLTPS